MAADLTEIRALLASVAGFTEGPWGWSADRELCLVPGLVTPRGLYIMTAWTAAAPVEVKPCTPADGRILAAAPDLHRELTEAVGEIERLRAHNARMVAELLLLADACDKAKGIYGSRWGENGGAEDVACALPGDSWAETGAALRDLANDLPPIHDSDAMTAWEASRRLAAGEVDDG